MHSRGCDTGGHSLCRKPYCTTVRAIFGFVVQNPRICQIGGQPRRMATSGGDGTKPRGFVQHGKSAKRTQGGRPGHAEIARTDPRSSGWNGLHASERSHRLRAPGWHKVTKQSHDYRRGRDHTDLRGSADLWWQAQGRPSRGAVGPSGGRDGGTSAHLRGHRDGHAITPRRRKLTQSASRLRRAYEPDAPASESMVAPRIHSLARRARNESRKPSCATQAFGVPGRALTPTRRSEPSG